MLNQGLSQGASLRTHVSLVVRLCLLLLTGCSALEAQDAGLKGIAGVEVATHDARRLSSFFGHEMGLACAGDTCAVGQSQHLTFHATADPGRRVQLVELTGDDPAALRALYITKHVSVGELQRGEQGAAAFSFTDLDGNRFVVKKAARAGNAASSPISTHLRHVAIPVKSLEDAAAFYVGQLGFLVVGRTYRQGKPGWVNVAMGDPAGDFLQLALTDSSKAKSDSWTVEHLCFDVVDAYAAKEAIVLRSSAGQAIGQPVIGLAKFRKLMIHDPDGTPIELMEKTVAVPREGEHIER